MILLECCCYNAYTPLGGTKEEIEKSAKDFARLKIEKGSRQATLKRICGLLNIDEKYIDIFQSSLKNANKRLNGYWKKVVVGSAIGVVIIAIAVATGRYRILALLAPEGLSGAAAISAGLAALGGGAVAAGGYGMAGGIAVLVGGGSLLGIGAGGSMGILLASKNSNVLLSDAAKLEVVLKRNCNRRTKRHYFFSENIKQISRTKRRIKKKSRGVANSK